MGPLRKPWQASGYINKSPLEYWRPNRLKPWTKISQTKTLGSEFWGGGGRSEGLGRHPF
jgi:hypothetical protein